MITLAGHAHRALATARVTALQLAEDVARRGLLAALEQLDGSFVLAHWDGGRERLTLARDAAGQRSLYYGWAGSTFVFASTLDDLREHVDFHPAVDAGALALYLRHGYVPAPHCIYRDAFKLMAGSALVMTRDGVRRGSRAHLPSVDQQRWWSASAHYEDALQRRTDVPVAEALSRLDESVQRAVAASASARGPAHTGAYLSGGTDSSLVTAVLQSQCGAPVQTLGVGFEHPDHDERLWMERVAQHLGVRHETTVFRGHQVLEQVQRIPLAWHEPFADTSQIPTLLASQALAAHCSVGLTGDGGDELFFGHGAYLRACRNERLAARVPAWLRERIARLDERDAEAWRRGGMHALIAEASAAGIAHHYLMRVSRWRGPARLVPGVIEPRTLYRDGPVCLAGGDAADAVQYLDFVMELGNGILGKVEHAGRLAGVEPLAPLLDRGVISTAWQLPTGLKLREGEQKWILKQLLCRYLPPSLVMRPKRGFGPPIADWLRGPLRDWAEAHLAPQRLASAGLADTEVILSMWARFLAGERRWHPHLWTVLMYVQWFEHNRCLPPDPA